MSKIKVMDEVLANKIAAGEVVEKTMNVVKELVENSIDARATEITIKLIDSGVKEIEVSDNGVGMDKEDAMMAFSRHATSKLKNLDDLFYIESLGFRGEALPSIASVSNVRLKTSDGTKGTLVTLEGGENMQVSSCDLQDGTTITVSDLFYNTPVRLKYLKNLYIELANIVEYVDKMALSYPNIKFCLINNDKVLLRTDGSGELLKVIYQIYGADITKKMINISGENDDYYVSGYISYPEVTKSNRNGITTLVNGRVIRNNELKRFCKVMFKDKSKNLLERMLDYDYFLCLDVVDDKYLEIINNKGDIELVPIFDSEGMEQFDILEDTDEFLITNKIRKIIDKN